MLKKLIEKFKHTRIQRKLALAFSFVFILTAAVAVTGIISLINTRKAFSYMIDYPHERHLYLADAKYQLMSVRRDFIFLALLAGESRGLKERFDATTEALDIFILELEIAKDILLRDQLFERHLKDRQTADIEYMISGIKFFRENHLTPFYEKLINSELSGDEIQIELYRGNAIISPFVDVLNEMLVSAEFAMRNTQRNSDVLSLQMLWLLVAIAVVSAGLSVVLAVFVARMISEPIIKLVNIADNVANGNLNVDFDTTPKDEIGVLYTRFARVIGIINMFIKDLHDIGHAFKIDGDTTVRLNESQYKGTYAQVASAMNDILEYHVVSKDEILECISSIVDGEYDAPLKQFPGRESRINVSVDILRINVRRMEQIMMQKAESDAANKAKSTFLANMSHEIRTPMNSIMGITEILLHNENIPDDIADGLGKIYNSCNLLLGIINDILDFSKIEAGKLDIITAPYKIASLINDSVQLNMMRIESKPIEFVLKIDENIPAKLIGDELRIKQILNNLLSNAFKYTDAGKVTLTVSFKPLEDKDGISLIMSVEDTGHGMTQDQLEKLFVEYSRFHQRVNRTIEGTGLGLSITLSLVELMGGDIRVESEPNKGSVFTVEFPQMKIDSEILGKGVAENLMHFRFSQFENRKRSQIIRDPMPYGTVLIVDDVETNLFVAEGLMKLYKLEIDTVMSGKSAIDKVNEGKVYDVIFMDHMMPEMDGIETTKILRDAGYSRPIVALTANAVSGQADVFLEKGFDAFISKPIDIRQLNAVLNVFIRDKQPPEVVQAARLQNGFIEISSDNNGHRNIDPVLMESFTRDVYKTARLIEELLENDGLEDEKNMRKFTVAVHGIKSSLANIGEMPLSKFAYKLEQDGKDGNIGDIKASVHDFLSELKKLLEKKYEEQKTEEKEADAEDEQDIEDLREKMLAIQHACADYDRKLVFDIMAEIKNRSKWTRMVLDNIMGFVLHSEFEKAEREAASYADVLYGR